MKQTKKGGRTDLVPLAHEQGDQVREGEVIWTCSIHPQIRLPAPGKCPICFMDLIPAKQDSATGETAGVGLAS